MQINQIILQGNKSYDIVPRDNDIDRNQKDKYRKFHYQAKDNEILKKKVEYFNMKLQFIFIEILFISV